MPAIHRGDDTQHARLIFFHRDLDNFCHVRREAPEAGDPTIASLRQRLAPGSLFRRKLQYSAHAGGVPRVGEEWDVLILGQQVKPVLERIFSRRFSQFIDKTLGGKCDLQCVNRAHPSQRNRRLRHHIFNRGIRDGIDQGCLVGEVGINSVRCWRTFLSANGRCDDAMGKGNRPARSIEHGV